MAYSSEPKSSGRVTYFFSAFPQENRETAAMVSASSAAKIFIRFIRVPFLFRDFPKAISFEH